MNELSKTIDFIFMNGTTIGTLLKQTECILSLHVKYNKYFCEAIKRERERKSEEH